MQPIDLSSLLGMGAIKLEGGMLERLMYIQYIFGFFAVFAVCVVLLFLRPHGSQQDNAVKEKEQQVQEKGRHEGIPAWVHPGAKPPSSFDELCKCTPVALLRCRVTQHTCPHNRLSKVGSNAFKAKVKCKDCGDILAEYTRPTKP